MRTRRTAAAVTSLLALSLLAACGEEDGSEPDAEGSPTASATASGSPSESPSEAPSASPSEGTPEGSTKLTTRGLSVGEWPTIAYAAAEDPSDPSGTWAWVQSGGATRLPVTGIQSFVTIGDGAVAMVNDGADDTEVVIVDGTGAEVRREDSQGYRLARTPDHSVVAWLTPDLTTTVLGADGTTLHLTEAPGAGEIAAISGGEHCPDVTEDGAGCTAYFNGEQSADVYFVDSHGQSALLDGPLLRLSDIDTGIDTGDRLMGLTSVDDLGSCSGVVGERRKPDWETCDHTLTSFSPDGTRVLGTDPYLDGFGQRSVVFLDSAGTVLHQFASKGQGATVVQTAWEDSDHVLAVVYERGQWSILRLGVDGSAELAVEPVEGSDLDRPFVLEQD